MSRPTPLLLALLLAAAVPLTACGGPRAAVDPRTLPPLVRVAVAGGADDAGRQFTGVVSARVQSDLGFRVPGKVIARLVDAGQVVHRGQPLMRIDATDYALALDAVRARAVQAAAEEKRYRDLVSAGAVSASAYDQVKAAADATQAEMRRAQDETGYSVLTADADGVVVETLAEPGQVVTAGQTVIRLAHSGPREATISLPETARPAIGSAASATLFGAGASSGARLRQLSSAADPATRTYEAKYVLDGAGAAAPLGATVTIALPDAGGTAGLQVPLAALYDDGSGPGLWIVGGQGPTVSFRRVRLGAIGEETATVTAGLGAGERFVAMGAHLLHQGQRVQVSSRAGAN